MFKKNQRVLYMGHQSWHVATVLHTQTTSTVIIGPVGKSDEPNQRWIPFDAPVERLSIVPDNINTVEAAIAYLHSMGNWADKS